MSLDSYVPTLIQELSSLRPNPHLVRDRTLRHLHASLDFGLKLHPYGFLHTTLGTGDEGQNLRLHVWIDGDEMRDLPTRVHAHAWTARSHLLTGRLFNETYSIAESGSGDYRMFSVEYRGEASVRLPDETRVNVKLSDSQEYAAGDSYDVAHGVYHRTVVPSDQFTATLFMTSPPISTPLVVGLLGEEEEYVFRRVLVGDNLEQKVITKLANMLVGKTE